MTQEVKNYSTMFWCDLKTDEERIAFLKSGRACETGIIAPSIVDIVIHAFQCRIAVNEAIDWANGREVEWGERARNAFDFLYIAINGVKKYGD